MSIAEKLVTVAENQQKIFDAGKQAEYDAFWDTLQENGNRKNYSYAFSYYSWTDDIYNPKYPFYPTGCSNMFVYTNLTDIKVPLDLTNPNGNQKYAIFVGSTKLKTIPKLIVDEKNAFSPNGTYPMFHQCSALENITFEGTIGKNIDFKDCTLLSRESIENIVSCLSETATGQVVTLSNTAVNNAFTTDEWNVLIADKTNWTISLV